MIATVLLATVEIIVPLVRMMVSLLFLCDFVHQERMKSLNASPTNGFFASKMLISQLQAAENKIIFITSLYKKLQNCSLTVSQICERI